MILGDGEMKNQIIQLSKNLGLKTYSVWSEEKFDDSFDVYFIGFQKNPFKFVKASKLFAMTSLWEGFGNTIVEAMACGTPVISTDCKSGPREIICPELNNTNVIKEAYYDGFGILMPEFDHRFVDENELLSKCEQLWVDTIKDLLNNNKQLFKYSESALERSEDFSFKYIMEEWKDLIEETLLLHKRENLC
jgi:glycosyltransferase involved in cell wall biosynthesis